MLQFGHLKQICNNAKVELVALELASVFIYVQRYLKVFMVFGLKHFIYLMLNTVVNNYLVTVKYCVF